MACKYAHTAHSHPDLRLINIDIYLSDTGQEIDVDLLLPARPGRDHGQHPSQPGARLHALRVSTRPGQSTTRTASSSNSKCSTATASSPNTKHPSARLSSSRSRSKRLAYGKGNGASISYVMMRSWRLVRGTPLPELPTASFPASVWTLDRPRVTSRLVVRWRARRVAVSLLTTCRRRPVCIIIKDPKSQSRWTALKDQDRRPRRRR